MISKSIFVFIFPLSIFLSSCSYRFSNTAMSSPVGVKTIAFQGVYNTSRKVWPAHVLWGELQRSFARKGKMRLTKPSQADILLRAQIEQASSSPGDVYRSTNDKDPKGNNIYSAAPEEFRNLLRAGSWALKESMNISVKIEVWDLRTKKKLFSSSYPGQATIPTYQAENVAEISTHYLLFQESKTNAFKAMARSIADKAASDFLL